MEITVSKIKFIVVSDFHAGDGSSADNLGIEHCQKLISKILEYEAIGFKPVFLGDIFEAIQFSYSKIIKTYPDFVGLLKRSYVVTGNHDRKIASALNINAVDELIINKQVLLFHGHQFDKPVNPLLVRIGLRIWRYIEILLGRKISGKLTEEPISPNDPRYKGDKSNYIKKARDRGVEENYRFVIIGHTHEPGTFTYEDVGVRNTGTCQNGHIQFVLLDDSSGRLRCDLRIEC